MSISRIGGPPRLPGRSRASVARRGPRPGIRGRNTADGITAVSSWQAAPRVRKGELPIRAISAAVRASARLRSARRSRGRARLGRLGCARTARRPHRRARRSRARRRSRGSARRRPQSWRNRARRTGPAERLADDLAGVSSVEPSSPVITTPMPHRRRDVAAVRARRRSARGSGRRRPTGSASGVTASEQPVELVEAAADARPGPDGPPSRSQTTTSKSSRSSRQRRVRRAAREPDAGARARQHPERRLVHRRRAPHAPGASRSAKSSRHGPRTASRVVTSRASGSASTTQTRPRPRGVAGQARGEVRPPRPACRPDSGRW